MTPRCTEAGPAPAEQCQSPQEPAAAAASPFFNRNHKPTDLALLFSSRPSAWGSDWEKWLLWKNPYSQHQTKTQLKRARATCDLFLGILLDLLTARELVFETLVLLKCMEPSLSPHHAMSVCLHPPFVIRARIQPWLLHSNSWDSANQTGTYNRFLGAGWGHNLVWCGLNHILLCLGELENTGEPRRSSGSPSFTNFWKEILKKKKKGGGHL